MRAYDNIYSADCMLFIMEEQVPGSMGYHQEGANRVG
jgi:hypothetical protein